MSYKSCELRVTGHLVLTGANSFTLALAGRMSTISIFTEYLPRKEVIHPQLPLRMPCYDFTLITNPTLVPENSGPLGIIGSLGVTGGEYKTRERIQRGVADPRLLAIPAS